MAIDGVPLFMGGDEVEHSAELMRMLNWSIYRGQEGFLTSAAGRCETRLTPGEGVRLLPGPFVVNSRFVGGDLQSYLMRIINDEDVPTTPVPPGFPGGFRYDLVVCNVEDPFPSDGVQWPLPQTPDGRRLGPYWRPRVIENVPANCVALEQIPVEHPSGAHTWTAIPSARLRRPANTATVTNDMITRINMVCNPLAGIQLPQEVIDNLEDAVSDVQGTIGGLLSGRIPIPGEFIETINCQADSGDANTLDWTQGTFKRWPREALGQCFIPTWATHAECFAVVINPYQKAGHIWGETRINVGSASTSPTKYDQDEVNSGDTRPASPGSDTSVGNSAYKPGNRPAIFSTGPTTIVPEQRGKKISVELQARSFGNDDLYTRGRIIADGSTSVYFIIQFKEKP